MKEMEAKQKLLDIQMTLQKDIKNLEATQNLKKNRKRSKPNMKKLFRP